MSSTPRPKTSTPMRARLRDWAFNLLLVILVIVAVQWWKARPLVSGEAPALQGRDLNGHQVTLQAFRGTPVLVYFWATWCPVCVLMADSIQTIAHDYPVITIAMQSGGMQELTAAMQESGHDYRVIPDPSGTIARDWGVSGVPSAFVIDAQGRISFRGVGLSTEPGLRLRLWMAAD
ncbi:hypothetical protein CKO25_05115 [Thiocapsa imhoffii]|uniref:Thioredoxin domain-containing protein n=1 Tax=Thiocapsa imhoffii TaxID=382777 RepID=A0A9X1B7N8_9GAMM|nr:protein disulfide oxidoreductase [Thiocapsa imhoffii]MBK1644044.1 hypothetical protein [Thiocapsa imhoffii]